MKSFVVETARHLHEVCGYDVTLICDRDDAFAETLPAGIRYIPVRMARGINLSGFSSISEFRRIFREERFDLVQYATPNAACYASIAAKKEKVPVRLYCQWGIRYVGLFGLSRKIFKFLEKRVCANSTHIRAVSPLNMAFAIKEGLYAPDKAKVIGNGGTIGVDLSTYDADCRTTWSQKIRNSFKIEDNSFVYGFAGRISADKGCSELLEAFRAVCSKNEKSRLLVVGPLEDNCGVPEELIDWAKNSDKVIFTGRVENKDMRRYYSAMDVLVHPTYREGFGMVIQEAGALGVPVITTKIPGASEVMEDGLSCALVAPKSCIELKNAMIELINDEQKTKSLGRAAYERTCSLYARPIMLKNQEEDYRSLLGD